MIIGDEGRMRQILFNLVGNAVKFTKKGSVRVDVQMLRKATAPGSARLLFTVTDTGIGIPDDKLETIFDPFIQLNWGKSRKYEGTGLGLGIVRRLVSRMGGIITVDSCVNKGTTVDFWVNIALP
jgi:signal transduction histidine kinase